MKALSSTYEKQGLTVVAIDVEKSTPVGHRRREHLHGSGATRDFGHIARCGCPFILG